MDINIYRIILLKALGWKELIKLTEIKQFYKIVNHSMIWRNIFEKQFPEHIDMIEDKTWQEIKNIFKDLWINGAYFYVPTLMTDNVVDNFYAFVNYEDIVNELKFIDYNMLLLRKKNCSEYKRTNEKYIAQVEYKTFRKQYPIIFYNNLRYNITLISAHEIGEDNFIYVCSEIKLYDNSVELF